MKPLVTIVGRTNVGKSTLFNRLVGRRVAIIEDRPGVTRDRLCVDIACEDRLITLVDTGGLVDMPEVAYSGAVEEQTLRAVEASDAVLFMVDGRAGLVAGDREIAEKLRRSDRPVVLVVNKVESPRQDLWEFAELGIEPMLAISALNNQGIDELLQNLASLLPAEEPEEVVAHDFAVAIVGRPNVGKSMLLNALLQEERSIVSEHPGTTRDAVDTLWERNGHRILLTDTAGLRKKGRIHEDVEYYGVVRALRAIDRSDLVLLVLDATQGVGQQDQRIAGYAHEKGKLIILVVNKWDLMGHWSEEGFTLPYPTPTAGRHADSGRAGKLLRADFGRELRQQLRFLSYAQVLFVSALTGQGLQDLFSQMLSSMEDYTRRVPTGPLNRMVLDAAIGHPPPMRRGRRLKIFYATQADVKPPTIVLFVNDPELMHFSYERYLVNSLRNTFSMKGTPVRVVLRKRQRRGALPNRG